MSTAIIASALETFAEVIGALSMLAGLVAVVVLWWLMVGRPSRRERAQRGDHDGPPGRG